MAKTEKEIEVEIDLCYDSNKYPAMTYEEGVLAALEWVIGTTDEPPMTGQ